MLVKLRVNQSTFMDIMERVMAANCPERLIIDARGRDGEEVAIDLSGVAIVVDPKAMEK